MISRRGLLGAAGVALGARGAWAAIPPVVRIGGGASYRDGKVRLSNYAYVIEEQGWLAQELAKRGSKLEWFTTSHAATGPQINEGFANGTLHFAGYGDLPSAILNAGGVETRLLVPHGVGQGDAFLVAPASSSVRSIEDLKGKRLAVHRGRPWELPLLRLLKARGLSYTDFRLFNINPQAGMAALAAGHVDGLFTMTDAYLLEDKAVGRIVWSTKEAPLDWKTRTELWASKAFVDANPEIAQLVVTAALKAAHWASLDENQEAMIKIGTLGGTPESVVRRAHQDRKVSWRDRWSPLFHEVVYEHYRKTVELALEQKIIRKPVSVDAWFDKRFVARGLKDLGLEGHWKPFSGIATQKGERT